MQHHLDRSIAVIADFMNRSGLPVDPDINDFVLVDDDGSKMTRPDADGWITRTEPYVYATEAWVTASYDGALGKGTVPPMTRRARGGRVGRTRRPGGRRRRVATTASSDDGGGPGEPAALAAALDLAARGLALLPLRPRSKEPHAHLLLRVYGDTKWGPLAQRRASAAEIRAWFVEDPDLNIGVILGQVSGGLVVLDLDKPVPGLQHPPTPTVRTGRGLHLYLRAPGTTKTATYEFGELRGDGSYVVAPGSTHPSGSIYEWVLALDEIDPAALSSGHGIKLSPELVSPPQSVDHLLTRAKPAAGDVEGVGRDLARVDAAVEMAMAGMDVEVHLRGRSNANVRCIVPGHGPDHSPSASLWKEPGSGLWLYRDWHGRGSQTMTLADLRASIGYGREVKLRGPERSYWYARLFYEAGVIEADPVRSVLPVGSSVRLRRVADGFALLQALRDLREPGEPVPFTRKFAAGWCSITEVEARAATEELRRLGALEVVGKLDGGRYPMNGYRLGQVAAVERATVELDRIEVAA